jgi:hypothetical protein
MKNSDFVVINLNPRPGPDFSNLIFGAIFGQVTHACGKKFFLMRAAVSKLYLREKSIFIAYISSAVFKAQGTFTSAMELCCSFGLRLLTLETLEKYECMINARVRK